MSQKETIEVNIKGKVRHRAKVTCDCGQVFVCMYDCTQCTCGQLYNLFGGKLLPREQWYED